MMNWPGRERLAATPRQVEARVAGNCWECATDADGAPEPVPTKPLHWYDSLIPGRTYRIKVTKLDGYSMIAAPEEAQAKLLGNTFDATFKDESFEVLGWYLHPNDVQLVG